jgi:hypothetical protein
MARMCPFYLARVIYLKEQGYIDDLISKASALKRKPEVARNLIDAVIKKSNETFDDSRNTFNRALLEYLEAEGGNEDAALKNTKFAKKVDASAKAGKP